MGLYRKIKKLLVIVFAGILEGGNHAGFGLYGRQDGDGTAAITSQEQMEQTAKLFAAFVK